MENNPIDDKTREIDWWFMDAKMVIVCEGHDKHIAGLKLPLAP